MRGEVTELLPNAMCRVTLENDQEVLGILSGKMKMYRIKVMRRKGRVYVINKKNPKNKQRQG